MELKKAPPPVSEINVTPMVDVMLVVLIIFMVITPMLNKGITVDMTKSHNPITMADQEKEDAITIAVTRDGKVYLSPGVQRVEPDQLAPKVKDLLAAKVGGNKMVFIRADQRAKYQKVEEVIDNLRAAGVDQLGLLTEQAPEKKGAAPKPAAGI
ncbi:MAG: biopolymer transporter ExbD [Acidobacteriota bacterium]|nr:biopolymer transporter ExbD [Acidobacteriota bacterium]